jgi:heme-degrading monooxygenase HmoA
MLKFFHQRYRILVLALLLMLNLLFGHSGIAQADKKPVQPLLFDPPEINVATIYETSAETQKDAMASIAKSSKALYKKHPGFDGFVVLKSKDGNRVIVLSQWKDLASYQAFTEQPVEDYKTKYADAYKSKFESSPYAAYKSKSGSAYASYKGQEAAATLEPTKTIIFEQETTEPSNIVANIRKESLVQLSEYSIKDPESKSQIIDFVNKLVPTADDMYPSPRSVVLLRSNDNSEVALLASWSCSVDFEGLETTPTFAELSDALVAAADNEQHLYEVMKIIPPPPLEPVAAS